MKKFLSFVLCMVLLCYFAFPLTTSASTLQDENYTPEFSELFAKSFISNFTSKEINVLDIYPIYSFDGSFYGNCVLFDIGKKETTGYILFSLGGHIHEFSLDGVSAVFQQTNAKFYYNGGYEFIAELENKKCISSIGCIYDNISEVPQNQTESSIDYKLYVGENNYGSGTPITAPLEVLPDTLTVKTITEDNIPSYHQNYQYMSDSAYPFDSDCGPVAALNALIYYDNVGYPSMITSSYAATYNEICNIANYSGGAISAESITNTLYSYANQRYPNTFTKYTDYYITHSDIIARTEEDTPFLFLVNGNSYYGNHFLLGLGYMKIECSFVGFLGITYNETNMFVRVADGWSYADTQRYVNFNDATLKTLGWIAN